MYLNIAKTYVYMYTCLRIYLGPSISWFCMQPNLLITYVGKPNLGCYNSAINCVKYHHFHVF